eukprot:TRINITY_DN73696_c0_g1_i1.p1 TRINITY_DN73696_c0_g1~~TRINITY_DN73696_c0_g1_i1.p1  ORF type:complete len:695 (+),score=209.50 TRINITY_DN73696_c0_g1_i1:82-2166(+)
MAKQQEAMAFDERAPMPRTAQQIYLHDHLQRMHNEIESTTRKLELEKRRLNKLEEDVTRMRGEHDEKVFKVQPKPAQQQVTSVRKLEHRLAKAVAQLNVLGHENKDVRDKIDSIRRERMQMNQVFKKLQNDIKENIANVTQIQRDTDTARREQEERQNRMAALKKQLEIERRQFKGNVQKMQKELKDREREELIQRVAVSRSHGDDDREAGGTSRRIKCLKADEEENFNSQGIMRRILKLAFLNAIQRRHIRQHQKNIEVFEQAFATIKSTTGISDIEEIVKIFVTLEQSNFSLLTYVNTLNREIEQFEKNNRALEEQIKSQKRSEEDNERIRTDKLSELQQQIQNTTTAIEENQLLVSQQAEVFERCQPLVHSLLKVIEKENRGFGGQSAPEFGGENMLGSLTYIERTLTQWKDFLPETKATKNSKAPVKNYKYTVGNQVLALPPKRQHHQAAPIVRAAELPSAANAFLEQGTQQRGAALAGRDEDTDTDEEELQNHPWTRQELRDKAIASVAKRKKHRKMDAPGNQAGGGAGGGLGDQGRGDDGAQGDRQGDNGQGELSYEDIVEKSRDNDEDSLGSDESEMDDESGPTDEEINEIFLKRYKMSREELQGMADKMGIQLNNLCYLKQEFDAYDEDRSGYIDSKELKGLLEKLGEALSDEELEQAFRELDQDGSGEIEFFEFVEWFTSEDGAP